MLLPRSVLALLLLASSAGGVHLREAGGLSSGTSVGARLRSLFFAGKDHVSHKGARWGRLPDDDGTIAMDPAAPSQHDVQGGREDVLEEQLDSGHLDRDIPVPVYALALGLLSGVSMPIGAYLGVLLAPVGDEYCAAMMALGAGALLFAVTVELYGHALHEVREGRMGMVEMNITMMAAVGGAIFYLCMNQWLEQKLGGGHEEEHEAVEAPPLPEPQTAKLERSVTEMSAKTEVTQATEEGTEKPDSKAPRRARRMSVLNMQDLSETGGRGGLAAAAIVKQSIEEHKVALARERWQKLRKTYQSTRIICLFKTSRLVSSPDIKSVQSSVFAKAWADACNQVRTEWKDEGKQEREKVLAHNAEKAKQVALGLFLGLLIDGVPEGILMGFLAAEGHLSPVFIVSLFVANFPEAFCSASLLRQAEMSTLKIVGMWLGLCILVGCLCGASCWLIFFCFPNFHAHGEGLPFHWRVLIASVEGLTGGAMIACISSVMLPEAFERAGKGGHILMKSGFFCVLGFLLSVFLKANGG
eukprot:TRINITY_DN92285_c0_g1_i1.p1 TRINITY_DN92285_c0_g1~~TRINITY_DN92285_c0_g1_i1.p1  ORF type:complete len:528 (+),score=133.86 TRINITY_DN92285_c0_g1_i1:183-1766(+)